MDKMITVTLVYALSPTEQFLRTLEVPVGSTVQAVIAASEVCAAYPQIDLGTQRVGIFSQLTTLDVVVKEGDRVEIYRPLIFDPMSARRLRAINQQNSSQSALSDRPQKTR